MKMGKGENEKDEQYGEGKEKGRRKTKGKEK
jgi:hypothetical protein